MKVTLLLIFGYLLGSLSPAALVSKIKRKNLRKNGTGNLGATNVMLNFGKKYGALVMLLDIAKAFVTVKLAAFFFPADTIIPLLAGTAVVAGHVYPFYMKFKGGKGLAAFGGLILAYDTTIFLILLVIGLALMLILNYGVVLPVSASILFPISTGLRYNSLTVALTASIVSIIIVIAHIANIEAVFNGSATKIREYIKNNFISRSSNL